MNQKAPMSQPDDESQHLVIDTFTSRDGHGEWNVWACASCRRRFYPACPQCVDVGHRNRDFRHEPSNA